MGFSTVNKLTDAVERIKFDPPYKFLKESFALAPLLGEGGSRICFAVSEKTVLKYPKKPHIVGRLNSFGIAQTLMEGLNYENTSNPLLAKCKLYRIGNFPVCLMERTEPTQAPISSELHETFTALVGTDGSYQIGITRDSRIVCFDYGCEESCDLPKDIEKFILSLPEFSEDSIKEFENPVEVTTL